jgi:hypothetical protein
MRLSLYTLGYPVRDIVDRAFDFFFFRKNVKSILMVGVNYKFLPVALKLIQRSLARVKFC